MKMHEKNPEEKKCSQMQQKSITYPLIKTAGTVNNEECESVPCN